MQTDPPDKTSTPASVGKSLADIPALAVRPARPEDAEAVAAILAESFPALYQSVFGLTDRDAIARLLTACYHGGLLSLQTVRLCEREGRVAGLAALHLGVPFVHGDIGAAWRLLRRHLPLLRALRALLGGITSVAVIERRIPRAPDLAYIEALAVAEAERGQGVGTTLLEDVILWGREHGRPRIALHVLHTNIGARRLYERMGFRPWREEPASRPGLFARRRSPWAAVLMLRLPLPTDAARRDSSPPPEAADSSPRRGEVPEKIEKYIPKAWEPFAPRFRL